MRLKITLDATEKACPIPFMMAKKEIDDQNTHFSIIVDNKGAVENLKRLADTTKYDVAIEEKENNFYITFTSEHVKGEISNTQEIETEIAMQVPTSWTLFIGKDTMGEGKRDLGTSLLRMFLYTIDAGGNLPKNIICMNSGVQIATKDPQTIQTLISLEKKGVSIIVCGTCLDYYNALDELQVGKIGNMYDITTVITSSPKVISI